MDMDEKSSSAVSDPKVAAFYDFVVKSNKFYCQKDLEALMKKHEIKSSRYKGDVCSYVINALRGHPSTDKGGFAAQRKVQECDHYVGY